MKTKGTGFLSALLCSAVFFCISFLVLAPSAKADASAYDKILVYNQYGGPWNDKTLIYGRTLQGYGCHLYTYAHAIQWLTSNARNSSNGGELLDELIGVCYNPSDDPLYDPPNDSQSKYNSHLLNNYGIQEVGVPGSASAIETHFADGGVIVANPGEHYHLAVGSTYADFDGNGSNELYIHIVDSSCQSTWWRTNQNFGSACYTYAGHSAITGYSRYVSSYDSNENPIYGYVNGTQGSKWGGGEYWVPYSVFSRYRRDRAYLPNEEYGYLTDPIVFNAEYYRDRYPDLQQAYASNDGVGLRKHWVECGIVEGRVASPVFDVKYYLAKHSDVANAYGLENYKGAVKHFIVCGVSEGRIGSAEFDYSCYHDNYKDLQDAFGGDKYSYYKHYIDSGRKEKRIADRRITIALDANGGTVEPTEITVTNFTPYGILPTPERNGFKFFGWYDAKSGGEKVTESSLVDHFIVSKLYAYWQYYDGDVANIITHVTVTDISSTGYTLSISLNPNWGAISVEAPTWTEDNGQDDTIWPTLIYSNGTATYRVNTSEHNNENGCMYKTHIYAKNEDGMVAVASQVLYPTLRVFVPAPGEIQTTFGESDFILPSAITVINESAFEGIAASVVYIPDTCTSIGKWAFRNCQSLRQIRIPANCAIGTDAFDGCNNVVIFGKKGSAAEAYANSHDNCTFVTE